MPSKTKHKKSSNDKFSLDSQKNLAFKKKTPLKCNIATKQKSKLSVKKQKSHISNKITPSLVSGRSEIPSAQETLTTQYSLPCLIQHKPSHITAPGSSRLQKRNMPQNLYNLIGSDYQEFQTQKFKSQMKWNKKSCRGSLITNQICHQYGYSNMSNAKSNIQKKSISTLSKKNRKLSEKEEIQRLFAKYSKHLDIPQGQKATTSKTKNFRTLSTDDKSEKKPQFSKRPKNRRKVVPNSKNIGTTIPSQQKIAPSNRDKPAKSYKKKKSSRTLLPDYFGCLSINKVESKLEMMKQKQKQEKNSGKRLKQTVKTQKNPQPRKSQENLVFTKTKEQRTTVKDCKELYNKQTKRIPTNRQLNSQRSTVSPIKLKSQDNIKVKGEKRSRKTSKKEIKST